MAKVSDRLMAVGQLSLTIGQEGTQGVQMKACQLGGIDKGSGTGQRIPFHTQSEPERPWTEAQSHTVGISCGALLVSTSAVKGDNNVPLRALSHCSVCPNVPRVLPRTVIVPQLFVIPLGILAATPSSSHHHCLLLVSRSRERDSHTHRLISRPWWSLRTPRRRRRKRRRNPARPGSQPVGSK